MEKMNPSKMNSAPRLVHRFEDLQAQRRNYEQVWDEITEFVLPNRGMFSGKKNSAGSRGGRRLFDSTAVQANEFLASTLHLGLVSPSRRWFNLVPQDLSVLSTDVDGSIATALETISEAVFSVLNAPESSFMSQNHEMLLDLTAYGTACMYVEAQPGAPVIFKAIHLAELYLAEDSNGRVDTVFRKFDLSARQAVQRWGPGGVSAAVKKAAMDSPDDRFDFLHCVKPNSQHDPKSQSPKKMKYKSLYIDLAERVIMEEGGFQEMPYLVSRLFKLVSEVYGRSPGWNALSDIRMINTMSETMIRAAQRQADPPLLLADDGVLMPLRTVPGGVNFGGLGHDGRPRVQALQSGARMDIGLDMMEQRRLAIRNAFFVDPLINRQGSIRTAEEVKVRSDQALRMLGPYIGRIQSELYNPLISRLIGILVRRGVIKDLPPALAEIDTDVSYTSPLSKTQRADEPEAVQNTLGLIAPLIQLNPGLMDNFDLDNIARVIGEVNGMPASMFKSVGEVEQERAQRQEQQQALAEQQAQAQQQELVPQG